MKICIVAEGSYPYTLGGVSSCMNTLIRACPEHEFIIYAISPTSSTIENYKYKLPENIIEVIDVTLDNIELIGGKKGKKYRFNKEQEEALNGLLKGHDFPWDEIFKFFSEAKYRTITDFFMSRNFFSKVRDLYINQYPYTPFTEFIWTMRSMYLTLFYLLAQKIPKADIYHSVSTGYAGILGSYGKFLYDKPFILSEHGIYTREREEEIIQADWVKGYYKELWIHYFYNLSRCAYNHGDVVTTLFKTNKELQIELGCSEKNIVTIPNGIDVASLASLPKKEKTDTITIGAIVRVVPIKDIKTMLRSFEIVKKEIENTRLVIMGPIDADPEYYHECLEIVKQMGLKDVEFKGTVDIKDYIWKMDILILTSISEGQPLSVMEGMAAGKPHICTNVGDCKELLYGSGDSFGKAGFIEYIMDYNGIAQSIIKLCQDRNLRETMGKNGYNRVLSLYKKEDFITSYKNLYKKFGSE